MVLDLHLARPMVTFSEIIHPDDQYEVAKARAEIAMKLHIGCIVARLVLDLIEERIPY